MRKKDEAWKYQYRLHGTLEVIQYSHSGDSFFPAQLISEMELLYDFKFVQDKCSVEDCGGLEICFKVDTGVTSDDFSN